MDDDAEALRALGWNDALRPALANAGGEMARLARVIAQHRDGWTVATAAGPRAGRLSGRLRRLGDQDPGARPAVGDWVTVEEGVADDGQVRIVAVLARRGTFVRKEAGARTRPQVVAANVDLALVVSALPHDLVPRRLERYLALAWESGAVPVVVLSKSDLAEDLEAPLALARAVAPGVEVLALSALTGDGVDQLVRLLHRGRTAALLGSSGVGKSTLVNRLLGEERQRTEVVRADGRGRHTTTHRELLRLPGGALLLDTPGMRELQLWSADAGLEAAFADVESIAAGCRFGDCRHGGEPGCAVLAAIASRSLDAERLESWRRLGRELAHLARREDERLAAGDRARLRSIMREARRHQRRKRGDR